MHTISSINNNTVAVTKKVNEDSDSNLKLHNKISNISFDVMSELPYIPFKIIRNMAAHNLAPFVQKALTVLGNRPISVRDAETSCILNTFALMVIFSGVGKTNQMKSHLLANCIQPVTLILPRGKWTYYIEDMFVGKMVAASIGKFATNTMRENSCNKARLKHVKSYENYIKPIMDQSYRVGNQLSEAEANSQIINNVVLKLRLLKFEFNRAVIESLKQDLKVNSQKINAQSSVIYYVVIGMPGSFDRKIHTPGEKKDTFYHAFIIEQFQGAKGVAHRLYQSWQNTMTLVDYFKKQNYQHHDEGCLSLDDIDEFLTGVNWIISPKTRLDVIPALRERYFGTPSFGAPLPLFFDDKNNVLCGFSLRYFYNQINPAEVAKNYRNFLKGYF